MLPLLLTLVHKHGQKLSRLPRPSDVHGAHISKSDDSDKACTKIGRTVATGGVDACCIPNGQQTRNLHGIEGEISALTCMIHPGGSVPSHRLMPHAHPARTTACVHPRHEDVVRWQCPSGKNPGL